ncbi:acVLRF1 family peptidyl-tRNA hydrolase [Sphaerisporangium rubeum]
MSVAPERLQTWLTGFTERHGPAGAGLDGTVIRIEAEDGALAECHVPFPPLGTGVPSPGTEVPPLGARVRESDDLLKALVDHALTPRKVGVLLVRLGGHAAGVFDGTRLVVSKVGSRQVHGRSAAGGWSQQRFARRREKQAAEASQAAADTAARVLTPHLPTLDAVVLGGDRRTMTSLRADRRLSPLFALETPPFLDVPDPRLAVLQRTPDDFRSVRIRVLDPAGGVDDQER